MVLQTQDIVPPCTQVAIHIATFHVNENAQISSSLQFQNEICRSYCSKSVICNSSIGGCHCSQIHGAQAYDHSVLQTQQLTLPANSYKTVVYNRRR